MRRGIPIELPEDLRQTLPPSVTHLSEIRSRYAMNPPIGGEEGIQDALEAVECRDTHHSLPYEMEHPEGCHVVPLLDPSCVYTDTDMRVVSALRGFEVDFKLLECFPTGKGAPVVDIMLFSPEFGYVTISCGGKRYVDISSQLNSLKRETQYAHSFVIRVVRKLKAAPYYFHYHGCSGNVVVAWALVIKGFTVTADLEEGNVVVIKLDYGTVPSATVDYRRVAENASTGREFTDTVTVTPPMPRRSSIDGLPPAGESGYGKWRTRMDVGSLRPDSKVVQNASMVDVSVCSPMFAGWYVSCNAVFTVVKPVERATGLGSFFRSFFA